MRLPHVRQYLDDSANIEGWFFPVDAYLFGFLDSVQREQSIRGDLFEIGVHHGTSALLLARMLQPGEHLGVCDVFGRQELNVDHSGEGSLHLFRENIRAHAGVDEPVLRIHIKSSHVLTADDTGTSCRLFHIDGGHRPEDVRRDLSTAERALHPAGVVIVDDVFNPSWPGVAEGFFQYLFEGGSTLVPLLIGGNKVYLCRAAAVLMYESRLHALEEIARIVPFTFEPKSWLGREVITAVRHHWADLDPIGTAIAHTAPDARDELAARLA